MNDHLAASTAAIDLLEHLEAAFRGTEVAHFAAALRVDVQADREERVMARVRVSPSRTRQLAGWIGHRLAALKLRLDDPRDGAFHQLEGLEVLSLGIAGKGSLWSALAVAAVDTPGLRVVDYSPLIERAGEQRERVEVMRLAAARAAFMS